MNGESSTLPGAARDEASGPDDSTGHSIAGRYRLVRSVGRGAHGEVWEAEDQLAKRVVAVKLLNPGIEVPLARIQLEVAALRQRVPGVVELLDDGVEGDRAYLVMELVRGRPFPFVEKPCAWSEIAHVTAALLETLARVHSVALIHRDLKPANVLVTEGGHVRILDFGIAYRTDGAEPTIDREGAAESPGAAIDRPRGDRLTEASAVVGTPAYAAPEQIRNERMSARTDLYAVGVMLYEALAGKRPHEESSLPQLLRAKLTRRPAPLADVAPGVPSAVARVVDRLLEIQPSARPGSATEVLALLAGERSVEAPFVPWLGSLEPLERLAKAARERRSIDVVGAPGSGRTRSLGALAQIAEWERRVVWLRAGSRAFESLAPIVGDLADLDPSATLDEVASAAAARLRQALLEGKVVLVDDAERVDRMSAAALARCLDAGTIVRALPASSPGGWAPANERIDLSPLREEDLRCLFAGPDLLLHLREDAARVLHRRTGGTPARVIRELTTWVRLGVAHWLRGLFVVQRDAIDRLESGFLAAAPTEAVDAASALPGSLADALAWITLAWPHTDVALLARAMGEARFLVEAEMDTLVAAGLVERLQDGRLSPLSPLTAPAHWAADRTRRAHEAVAGALPPGAPGRLQHLMLAGTELVPARLAIVGEAAALAERLIDEGRLGQAIATIDSGLRHVRGLGAAAEAEAERLVGLWVDAAIEDGKPHALDRVLYAGSRVDPRTPTIERLEALARAALGLEDWSDRPLARAEAIAPFAARRLERARHNVLLRAARRVKDDRVEERILDEIAASMDAAAPEREATLDTWRGRLRYRQGRFREAAELHARAAGTTSDALTRVHSLIFGAMASMEAFAFHEASELAAQAIDLSARHRHAYCEALARWIARAVAYRTGSARGPDRELVASVPFIGAKELEATIAMNEAAIAWRAADGEASRDLAQRALEIFQNIGMRQGVLISRGLLLLQGDPASDSDVRELCRVAVDHLPPGVGVQGLGLIALAGRLPADAVEAATIDELAATVPRELWGARMDVLSVDESLAAITALTAPARST